MWLVVQEHIQGFSIDSSPFMYIRCTMKVARFQSRELGVALPLGMHMMWQFMITVVLHKSAHPLLLSSF